MFGNAAGIKTEPQQLLLFTDEELAACEPQREKPKKEPPLKYFENPKNDNERLFNLQHDFIKNKNTAAYWRMWEIARKVSKNLIIKEMKKRGKKIFYDDLNDKIEDTCEYLLRRYFTRKNYCIHTNFIIALRDSMRHALDYKNTIDKNTTYSENITKICDAVTAYNEDFLS